MYNSYLNWLWSVVIGFKILCQTRQWFMCGREMGYSFEVFPRTKTLHFGQHDALFMLSTSKM
jgi:hypothetical protein